MGIPFLRYQKHFPRQGRKQAYEIEREALFCIYRRSGKKHLEAFDLQSRSFQPI